MHKINWYGGSVGDMKNLLDVISASCYMGNFDSIDIMIVFAGDNYDIGMVTALLRYTLVIRNKLPNWNILRDKLYDRLVYKGEDADGIMRGLLK